MCANRAGYDYQHHAEVGSGNAQFVADEVVDRFCIVGPAEEHRRRLRELAEAGVDQFNIYLMSGDEEATLEVYGREIMPVVRDVRRENLASRHSDSRRAAARCHQALITSHVSRSSRPSERR